MTRLKLFLYAATILLFITNVKANTQLPEIKIEKITSNVYLHKSYSSVKGFGLVSSNGLVVVQKNKAFIIDTPWSIEDTKRLVKWIEAQGFDVSGSLSTHSHDDRTAGIPWLNSQGIATYATKETNQILSEESKETATFELGSRSLLSGTIETFYPGEGHSKDNIVVWLPEQKLLFGGCLVKSLSSKGLGYTGSANLQEWSPSVLNVSQNYSEINIVVPGHGAYGNEQLLSHTVHLIDTFNKQ